MIPNPFDTVIHKDFNGKKFQAHKLRTSPLLKHGTRLAKILVPIMAEKAMQDQLEMVDFGRLADLFVDNIDAINLEELLPIMLHEATVNGSPVVYEEIFRGDFKLLIEVTKWLLEENFLNFLGGSMDMSSIVPQ